MDRKEARLLGSTMFWLLCVPLFCSGQENLISNWSFEELRPNTNGDTICPGSGGQIYLAREWKNANGSVDYFNACSNLDWPNFGVPSNLYGYQEAFEGEAYAQVACYAAPFPDAREYLMQELSEPLGTGQGYLLKFRLNLADSVNFAASNIGVFFSEFDPRLWDDEDFFDVVPVLETSDQVPITDKEGWTEVTGQFVAAGAERFLIIGCFHQDSEVEIVRVSNHAQAVYSWEASSYLIDGVELYEDNSIGVEELSGISVSVYPNPTNGLLHIGLAGETEGSYTVRLVSINGLLIREEGLSGSSTILDIADLSKGIYFVEVTSSMGEGLWRGKVILLE